MAGMIHQRISEVTGEPSKQNLIKGMASTASSIDQYHI
eukprot:CAMPEP_0170205234 /NCGR_PEP_ID=MMETSP0116_2-20130129/2156_1 /TAXON_ID=400756 /ORGANISM="Durinskia baltica, Strain CSIRO CS-38" /LENGTH=37 /DNA_ID= /DNA_START= /DNA_END= /DNA_ORIENTATION=